MKSVRPRLLDRQSDIHSTACRLLSKQMAVMCQIEKISSIFSCCCVDNVVPWADSVRDSVACLT